MLLLLLLLFLNIPKCILTFVLHHFFSYCYGVLGHFKQQFKERIASCCPQRYLEQGSDWAAKCAPGYCRMGFAVKAIALSQKPQISCLLINGVFIVIKVQYVKSPWKEVYGCIWSKSKIKSKSKSLKNEYEKSG